MKRIIVICCCFLTTALSFAQQGGNNGQGRRHEFSPELYRQNMEAFVAREAQLTPDEAQRLFPILHEMLGQQRRNNEAQREAMRSCGENATESDYEKAVKRVLELDVENKRLEQDYYKKFHSVISWKKIHAVRFALWRFQMEALKHFTPHGDKNGPRNQQNPGHRRNSRPGNKSNP